MITIFSRIAIPKAMCSKQLNSERERDKARQAAHTQNKNKNNDDLYCKKQELTINQF